MMPDQCPQLAKLPENVRKFWEDKQREVDDTLIRFSYAVLTESAERFLVNKSGILYLMKNNLWFEDFPKPPLFFFLGTKSEYKKTLIQMPRAALGKVEIIPESALHELFQGKKQGSGFFQNLFRLFGAEPRYLLLSGKQASGSSFQYAFHELDDPQSWVQTLSEGLETRK